MNAGSASKLYSPALLSLATELANYPLSGDWPLTASARSRTCGSTVEIGLRLASDGAVESIGLKVAACAVGQASAAVLARSVAGKSPAQIEDTRNQIASWLAGPGSLPDWPEFGLLEAARGSKGRHGALLLPWNATVEALSMAQVSS